MIAGDPSTAVKIPAQRVASGWLRMAVIAVWIGALTLTMQFWVGKNTIYSPELVQKREQMHQMLLENRSPAGGWGSVGANGTNIRVVSVFGVDAIHRVTGISVSNGYFVLDTVMLFVALALLLYYLSRLERGVYTILGVLFVGTVLPLTYQQFYFHPWDRLSLVCWISLLALLHARKLMWFAVLLPFAVAVKYDVMLLPGLYFFAETFRVRRVTKDGLGWTIGLLGIGIGTYVVLGLLRPGGSAPASMITQLTSNLRVVSQMHLRWPPLLGFAVPATLTVIAFLRCDPWARACAVFGLLLMVPFALQSNLSEFRAHMPVLILLAPAALTGVRALLGDGAPPQRVIVR